MPPADMNLSINGQSQVPPGFRFHPTEEELLHYYLRKKVAYEKIDLDVIREVDLNKLEPWDIQEKCKIGSTPQNDWYFFSHKDKKYPTGTRTNRATAAGFWKATGRDKIIYSGFRRIGLRKTLVFYKGRAPHGQKSDWIMHEYRLDDTTHDTTTSTGCNPIGIAGEAIPEEGWVVCRVFRKKNYQKTLDSPKASSSSTSMNSKTQILQNDGVLDQILVYMGRTCKMETESFPHNINNTTSIRFHDRFMHLPRLDSPSTLPNPNCVQISSPSSSYDHPHRNFKSCYEMLTVAEDNNNQSNSSVEDQSTKSGSGLMNDWVTLDRLVASQLNGQAETTKQLSCFSDPNGSFGLSPDDDIQLSHIHLPSNAPNPSNSQLYNSISDNDLWSFTKSSSSPSSSHPLCHLSV